MKTFNYIFLLLLLIVGSGCTTIAKSRGAFVTISHKKSVIPNEQQISQFGNYHALLIYVDNYSRLDRLKTPKNDVESIAKVLKNRYGFRDTTIISNPKNRDELVTILDNLSKKMRERDNLLIYYAGHGTYFKKSDTGFWLLKDAHKENRTGWISLNEAINFTLNNMKAKHVLVLSDSCYSGAIVRDAEVSLNSNQMSYRELSKLSSRTALTSGGLEPVMDGDFSNSKNSVFANGVLNALNNNTKPRFRLEEKFAEIKQYVKLKSNIQTPLYSDIRGTGHNGGDFIFVDRTVNQPKEPIYTTSLGSTKPHRVAQHQAKSTLPYLEECDRGDGKACYNASIMYKKGDHRVSRSDIVALGFLDKSCTLGYAKGCLGLGFSYLKGRGVPQSQTKARLFLNKACSMGLQKACVQ
jgi:hypothetical protein